jgi:hypothetical protein
MRDECSGISPGAMATTETQEPAENR